MECTIEKNSKGAYYTMTIDGHFAGNYDTVTEAAMAYDQMVEEGCEFNE